MAKKSSGGTISIRWPFIPTHTNLNSDTNFLKLIAMLAMLCDHAGKMLFPQYPIMRCIGRLAFPIYAYCIAVGCIYTHNPLGYAKRIVTLALVSQPIYAVAMAHESKTMYAVSFADNPVKAVLNFYVESWTNKPSILLSLTLGVLLIWSIRNHELVITVVLALIVWKMRNMIDYGWKGIVLMVIFYLFCAKWWLALPAALSFMVWWGLQGSGYTMFGVRFSNQMFAIFALIPICIHMKTGLKLPKWLFYLFYPAHLVLIYLLDQYVI